MKRREQALLFLRKAAQDEALLDAVLESDKVSDEVIGFHCQQAAEKMLKALLSDLGITFHKTHELGALMDSLARSGAPLPGEFENLDILTPFGAVYRYDDYDGTDSLNRAETRALLRSLRAWVEDRMGIRPECAIIYGIDFTSVPSKSKPITQAVCRLSDEILQVDEIRELYGFEDFECFLRQGSPWIAALDFPFGQPRTLIENLNWPDSWNGYVGVVESMTRQEFVDFFRKYQDSRHKGDKRHLRAVDKKARSRSPMQLDFTPVAQMFYEGAKRLRHAPVNVVPFRWEEGQAGTVVEGYPALVARRFIGKARYKTDDKGKWTAEMEQSRRSILRAIQQPALTAPYELSVRLSPRLAQDCIEDGTGDTLDAVLCAMQAGWAHRKRAENHGAPPGTDLLEGWITDPSLL